MEKFCRAPREEQILLCVYAQERDEEELEHAIARSIVNMIPITSEG